MMPNIEITGIIEAASDVAQNNLLATMQQTDGVHCAVVGFSNNVVCIQSKKLNDM